MVWLVNWIEWFVLLFVVVCCGVIVVVVNMCYCSVEVVYLLCLFGVKLMVVEVGFCLIDFVVIFGGIVKDEVLVLWKVVVVVVDVMFMYWFCVCFDVFE